MADDYRSSRYWDTVAATFDDEPDHGLRDPAVRSAWREHLQRWLPHGRRSILDAGCGTGSLAVLLAQLGYQVTGVDRSAAMLARAGDKATAAGAPTRWLIMDAAIPGFAPQSFDAILCRHLLWALAHPARVLQQWVRLLKPGGRLILIEGYWHTGGGLRAATLAEIMPADLIDVQRHDLSVQPLLWGGEVTDERYVVIARRGA